MSTGISWLDVKLGARMLVKHPGLTVIGGFAIAVAIAIGATVFEIVSQVLHPVLPLPDGGRVVAIQYATDDPGTPERRLLHDFLAWREELTSIEQLGAFRNVRQNLVTGEGHPEPVRVAEITASGFQVARTPPLLGRHLVPEDERPGAPPVVVIGHAAWQSRFAGDPDVVGRIIRLADEPHTVVGVMPDGFAFPVSHQVWVPLRAKPADYGPLEGPALYVFGRLAPGVTLGEARAELTTVGRRTAAAHPETHERLRPRVLPYGREHVEGLDRPILARALWVLRFLVGGLLAVVAANLAILVYARTVARLGELAMRSALGASRRRILAQLFIESFALAAVGAVFGLALAHAVLRWIGQTIAVVDVVPFWIDFELSAATVLFALGLAVLAAAIMGVLPGLRATGSQLYANLRELGGGPGMQLGRVWTSLVVAQVAIAVAILPVAVFTVSQIIRIEVTEIGFPVEEYAVGVVTLAEEAGTTGTSGGEAGGFATFLRTRQLELIRRLEAEADVSDVAFSSGIPGIHGIPQGIELDGGAPITVDSPKAGSIRVSLGMFDAYDAEILAGRPFHAGDLGAAANVVIVNRTFVRQYLGNRPALGERLRYPGSGKDAVEAGSGGEWYEIVGVVEDFPAVPLELASAADGVPNVYHPVAPGALHPLSLTVRFGGGIPADFARRIQVLGAEVDPRLQLRVRPLAELYGSLRSGSRFMAWGLALVTSTVLLLAAAGMYALMSFTVAQRTREIGIRAALGAHPRRILASIFGRVVRQLALGLLIGSLLSSALFLAVGSGIGRTAVLLFAVAAVVLTVGLLAAVGPARRGLRIEPTEALRAEA